MASMRVADLAQQTNRQFALVDQAFREIDGRFKKVDERFDEVDKRFGQVDERFNEIDRRFEKVDERFDKMDERFDRVEGRLDLLEYDMAEVKTDIRGMREEFGSKFDWIITTLDRFMKRMEDYHQELVMLTGRVSRHDGQIEALARHAGIDP